MYSPFRLALKYGAYYAKASDRKGHGMHSPFVFDFIKNVLNDRTIYPEYLKIEALRKNLLADKRVLNVTDMGAGSAVNNQSKRTIAALAASAAKPPKYARLLHRLVKYYRPKNILEFGTSLGISAAYLANGNPSASVITMEGSGEIASTAIKNFESLSIQNIQVLQGNFDNLLPGLLQKINRFDLVFIDGNHRQEPTERYFNLLKPALHNDSIIVFDDIHWSKEMEMAWRNIISDSRVRCSIDLFFVGIVFLREEFREKQHFAVRF